MHSMRLRITRDATTFYGNQRTTPGHLHTQQNSLARIAGEWSVDDVVGADIRLKAHTYNRTNINRMINSALGQQNAVTTGLSISHTQSFNELRDIWRSSRNRRKNDPESNNNNGNEEATRGKDDGSE